MHYCMGELATWGFSHNKNEYCSNCGMKESESKGCCKHENKFLKIVNDQKTFDAAYQLAQSTSLSVIKVFFDLTCVYVPSVVERHTLLNVNPRSQSLPLFIRNSTFRI